MKQYSVRIILKLLANLRGFVVRWCDVLFSIDTRALAMMRILLAFGILIDLAIRAQDITLMHGGSGVYPPSIAFDPNVNAYAWSLHLLFGGPPLWVVTMFIIHASVTIALLFGFYTRSASVLSWICITSLHMANPLVLNGGDTLLRSLLFIGMFLPWGHSLSVDGHTKTKPESYVSVWTVAVFVQIACIYFFAALFKHDPLWFESGSALYYALSMHNVATSFASLLLPHVELITFFAVALVSLQHAIPILLLFPFRTNDLRLCLFFVLITIHASFTIFLHIGMFSLYMIATLMILVPGYVWDTITTLVKRWLWFADSEAPTPHIVVHPATRNRLIRHTSAICGIFYIVFMLTWNIAHNPVTKHWLDTPKSFETFSLSTMLYQRWSLFTATSITNDGWHIARGTTIDGRAIDLLRNGAPISYDAPTNITTVYPNEHWRKFLMSNARGSEASHRQYLSILCDNWNTSHRNNSLERVELLFMVRRTPPPGAPEQPLKEKVVELFECSGN